MLIFEALDKMKLYGWFVFKKQAEATQRNCSFRVLSLLLILFKYLHVLNGKAQN